MAQIYTFDTVLLSAAKTGYPNLVTTSLSGNGVGVVSLSTNDVGIAFSSITPLGGVYFTTNVAGSIFNIDTAYSGQTMALVGPNGFYTTFTFLSTDAVTNPASFATTVDVSTPDSRRKYLLGYI